MKGQPENNQALAKLRGTYPFLTPAELTRITSFSYTFCYGWTVAPSDSCHKQMPDAALRLLRFELGLALPEHNTAQKRKALMERRDMRLRRNRK